MGFYNSGIVVVASRGGSGRVFFGVFKGFG